MEDMFESMEAKVKQFTYHLESLASVRDFDFDSAFKDLKEKLDELEKLEKEKKKIALDNENILRGIAKSDDVMESNQRNIQSLEADIQRLERKSREESKIASKIKNAIDSLGVRIEILSSEDDENALNRGSFVLKLSKVNPECMDKWYKIQFDITDNVSVVTKTEPVDLLDEADIATLKYSMNCDSTHRLRSFVTVCRNILISKFSKN